MQYTKFNDYEKISTVENFDISKPNSSELTSARASCISEVLVNLPSTSDKRVVISSTDLDYQIQVKIYRELDDFHVPLL